MPFKGAFQTTFIGSAIRFISRDHLLKYPDEYEVPEKYTAEGLARRQEEQKRRQQRQQEIRRGDQISIQSDRQHEGTGEKVKNQAVEPEKSRVNEKSLFDATHNKAPRFKPDPYGDNTNGLNLATPIDVTTGDIASPLSAETITSRLDSGLLPARPRPSESEETVVNPSTPSEVDVERGQAESGGNGGEEEANGDDEEDKNPYLVDWYGPDDPENPHNWSTKYKSFVAIQMSFLTFAVYIGSSIYSSGIEGIMEQFTVSQTTALVGLTVFVAGYGVGPMLWSPLSELSNVGRLPIYLGTLFVFVALQFPTIYANNIHTLLAMRFLAGFFGSPALAVGGATMGDMFVPKHLAYAIGVWGCGAVCGPVIGPLLGGFTYQAKGWTWPIWTLTWLSGACLVFSCLFFPETSSKNILHRRALRLRKLTGNSELKTQAMIDSAHQTPLQVIGETLWRPFVLFFDPILLVYNLYLALIYGLLYIWFESFPLVFVDVHGFNPGESGLAFMGIFVGAWLACAVFCWYVHKYLEPLFDANGGMLPKPEIRLYPAPIAAFCIPIAMFGFGWTGQYQSIHWIVPIIFTGFFGIGAFVLFQTIFAYFGDTFYTEMSHVLTLNDLFRASWGAGFPLFANALFKHLGIGGGNSLLGGLACLFIPAPFLFIKYGHKIRERSKYASNKA